MAKSARVQDEPTILEEVLVRPQADFEEVGSEIPFAVFQMAF
jgi:hypothetical protein